MARLEVGVDITVEGARELDKVGDALGHTSDDLDTLASKLDEAADAARTAADDIDTAAGSISFDGPIGAADTMEARFQGVNDTVSGLTDVFTTVGDDSLSLTDKLTGVAGGLADLSGGIATFVLPALSALSNMSIAGIKSAATMALSFAAQIAGWVATAAAAVANAVIIAGAWVIALGPIALLVAAVIAAVALIILNWDKVTAFIGAAIDVVKGWLSGFADFFGDVWDGILSVFEGVADAFGGIWDTITDAARAAWDGLAGIIKGAINVVISVINGFIGFLNGFQIHIPAIGVGPVHTPAFDWWGLNLSKIPHLAAGGIIDRPTLALLGERGPEAVVPLSGGGVGTEVHYHLNVTGQVPTLDEQQLLRMMQRMGFVSGFGERLLLGHR